MRKQLVLRYLTHLPMIPMTPPDLGSGSLCSLNELAENRWVVSLSKPDGSLMILVITVNECATVEL